MTARRIIFVLYCISFFEVIARNLFGPVFAVYVKSIGGDLITSGTALAISTAVLGFFIIISGRIASRYHTEKLQLVLGYGLGALVYLEYVFVKNPEQLFAVQVLSGIAGAIELPAFSGLFSSLQKKGKHSRGWGDYFGLLNFVSAGALFASGAIAQQFGFKTLFLTMFAFELACMFGAMYLFADSKNRQWERQ